MKNFIFNVRLLHKFLKILLKKNYILNDEVLLFEKRLAENFGIRNAIGVSSGTDALVLALKAYGIGPGDEVVVAALGFFSTAGAVSWVNARPIFVDVTLPTFHMNSALIENVITADTKAIIITHLNGVVVDIAKYLEIAKKHKLILIEDYAQAFGSFSHTTEVSHGDIVCLSFNPTKILSAYGDGGALLTNDNEIAAKLRMMRMYGTNIKDMGKIHYISGIASRLGVWNAAALNLQLDRVHSVVSKRRECFFYYLKHLSKVKDIILPHFALDPRYGINGYRFVVLLKKRDEFFEYLKENRVDAQINYGEAIPFMPAFSSFREQRGNFPIAERIAREALTLPTGSSIGKNEINRIVKLIGEKIK